MEAVEARRAAALLFLLFSAAASKAQDARGMENRIPSYAPVPERLEILQPWEKRPGAEGSSGRIRPSGQPEIVAGISGSITGTTTSGTKWPSRSTIALPISTWPRSSIS